LARSSLLLDIRVLKALQAGTHSPGLFRPILDRVLIDAARSPELQHPKASLVLDLACKMCDCGYGSDQGVVDFGRWILEKEMRDGEGFQTQNESRELINRLLKVREPELRLRLLLRKIVFNRTAVTLADLFTVAGFLNRSESSYKDAVRERLWDWWKKCQDGFVDCFLHSEKMDYESRISHLDLKFSSLFCLLGKADWYASVIEQFVDRGGSDIYQDYRAVAATLFPLFRDPVEGADRAAGRIAEAIFPLSFRYDTSCLRGIAQENADRIYDSYQKCLAGLPDDRHENFMQLCKSQIDKQMRPGSQKKRYGWGLLEDFPFFGGSR
jgi:hypothetical protein